MACNVEVTKLTRKLLLHAQCVGNGTSDDVEGTGLAHITGSTLHPFHGRDEVTKGQRTTCASAAGRRGQQLERYWCISLRQAEAVTQGSKGYQNIG